MGVLLSDQPAPRGELPFRLCGEPLDDPLGIGYRVYLAHAEDRMCGKAGAAPVFGDAPEFGELSLGRIAEHLVFRIGYLVHIHVEWIDMDLVGGIVLAFLLAHDKLAARYEHHPLIQRRDRRTLLQPLAGHYAGQDQGRKNEKNTLSHYLHVPRRIDYATLLFISVKTPVCL